MSSYRIIKRGVLFGVEGDPLVRGDYDTKTAYGNIIPNLGLPVPIVFGTRRVEPVMVAWSSEGDPVGFWDKGGTPGPEAFSQTPSTGERQGNQRFYSERAILLTARMVLCLGQADSIGLFKAGNIDFDAYAQSLPLTYETVAESNYRTAETIFNLPGVQRFVVSAEAAFMFGGGNAGGLGIPFERLTYSFFTRHSEFWFMPEGGKTEFVNRDEDMGYHGMTSLYFKRFNFGGVEPIKKWSVNVTRVHKLTARSFSTSRSHDDQWSPVFRETTDGTPTDPTGGTTPDPTGGTTPDPTGGTSPDPTGGTLPDPTDDEPPPDPLGNLIPDPFLDARSLVSISKLKQQQDRTFYLIAFNQFLSPVEYEKIRSYLLTLPYDEETAYQFIGLGALGHVVYYDPTFSDRTYRSAVLNSGPDKVSPVYTTREEFIDNIDQQLRFYSDPLSQSGRVTDPTAADRPNPTNFTFSHAEEILYNYAKQMSKYLLRNEKADGVVLLFTNDLFGTVPRSRLSPHPIPTDRELEIGVNAQYVAGVNLMQWLTNPPDLIPTNIWKPSPSQRLRLGDVGGGLQSLQTYPAEVRVVLFKYFDIVRKTYVRAQPVDYNLLVGMGSRWGGIFFNPDEYSRIDVTGVPIIASATTGNVLPVRPSEFSSQLSIGLPFGETMNPIHALREILTNKDWGQGIREDSIDDEAFYNAAVVCHGEGLDYCNVITQLNSLNEVVKGITDYIDGVLYYNPRQNKVTIKLIRDDYTIATLPSFDESNISKITSYKRQHSQDLINSVTVKFYDVVKSSEETFTIHDMVASNLAGKVTSATISYDGCATARAAEVVCKRDLAALSQSVVSFTALIDPPATPLGLGDPLVFSYKDLGIARIVMRVSSISYGDGLTGGISVNLIQDVFSTIITSELVQPEEAVPTTPTIPPPVVPEPFDPFRHLLMEQASIWDLISNRALTSSGLIFIRAHDDARVWDPHGYDPHFNIGLKYVPGTTDNLQVSIGGQVLPVSVGKLLDEIGPVTTNPNRTIINPITDARSYPNKFKIRVRIKPIPSIASSISQGGQRVQINGEIMHTEGQRAINDEEVELTVTLRAQADTVGTAHAENSDVLFIDHFRFLRTTDWSGPWRPGSRQDPTLPITITQQGVTTNQDVPFRRIPMQNSSFYPSSGYPGQLSEYRALLPMPPAWVTVNGSYSTFSPESDEYRIIMKPRPAPQVSALRGKDPLRTYGRFILYFIDPNGVFLGPLSLTRYFQRTWDDDTWQDVTPVTVETNDWIINELRHSIRTDYPGTDINTLVWNPRVYGHYDRDASGLNFAGAGTRSWQYWNFSVKAVGGGGTPISPSRQGWGYDWTKDWGGGDATGWDYNWDNDWGD